MSPGPESLPVGSSVWPLLRIQNLMTEKNRKAHAHGTTLEFLKLSNSENRVAQSESLILTGTASCDLSEWDTACAQETVCDDGPSGWAKPDTEQSLTVQVIP